MSPPTFIIHPGVRWSPDTSTLGDFVVLGEPARGTTPGAEATTIGAGAVIRSHTVIYAGNLIGNNLETGHGVLIREFNRIGNHVSIGSHSVIEHRVEIGDGVRIHSNVFVPEYTVLEAGCWIGPGAVLTNARYPQSPDVGKNLRGPRVGAGAIVGAQVTLLPGVHVGPGALVGAGAVVIEDVPSGTVVVGNPARIVRKVSEIDAYSGRGGAN
jgi:acetyltransferase-like isoleucine patch superfamily enzyme